MATSYVERLKRRTGKKFRRAVGIRQRTFRQLYRQVREYLAQERRDQPLKRRGKKSQTVSIEDKLLLTLLYLRQYHTFDDLGEAFGISESYAQKIFHRVLDILVKLLRLPGKKVLLEKGIEAILIDVTEQPMERPVKKQRQWFSGKKKRHTIKAQLIVCLTTLQILLVVCDKGRTHDFKILKKGRLRILKELKKYGDSGYQGIAKLYDNSTTPHKKPKGGELTSQQKKENRILARLRIPIEHVNRRCKIFRIVKATYRGKHKHFSKVWTVIAGLVNLRYAQ
jgi:AraC-like DNA-binding protein